MAGTDQQQVRQDRYPKGVLDPSLLPADLMFPQAQGSLEFSIDLLHGPPVLIRTHHLSRDPLGQIGHQNLRLLRAEVSPSFAPNHCDITEVPQAQACARHPEGVPASRAREAGHQRLCAHVPWLRERLLCAVEEYARS